MARPAKNALPIGDTGIEVSVSLKQRGDIYSCKFPHPTIKGKYCEVTTGRRSQHEAWAAAAKIVLEMYQPTVKPTARNVTWEQVLEELSFAKGIRARTIELYSNTVKILRVFVETARPIDISEAKANRFAELYASTPYTRTKAEGAKQYTRSAKTVDNAIHFLSCLWTRLKKMGYVNSNPWQSVPRPDIPKKQPTAPTEQEFAEFFAWLDAKEWELMSVLLRLKSLSGCRTLDVCSLGTKHFDPKAGAVIIPPELDKTHRERLIPLPPDLAKRINLIKGRVYLWDRYTPETQQRDARATDKFYPKLLAMAVRRLFRRYYIECPERPRIKPHDFRRRAITLTVKATGSVDAAASALGVRPETAMRHYIDAEKAFKGQELMRKMADILLPQNPAPIVPEPEK